MEERPRKQTRTVYSGNWRGKTGEEGPRECMNGKGSRATWGWEGQHIILYPNRFGWLWEVERSCPGVGYGEEVTWCQHSLRVGTRG